MKMNGFALDAIETLVFAGGGNRCWWQAGLVDVLMAKGWSLPPHVVGTSAGAGVAAACLTDRISRALQGCLSIYAGNDRILHWRGPAGWWPRFAHEWIYPRWIASFVDEASHAEFLNGRRALTVAVTRPARYLGLHASVLAGTAAYLVDKYLWNSIHPRLPGLLGLRQDFVELNECATTEQAREALQAAAAAPPFMPARRLGAGMTIDGGFTDNAPIPEQTRAQRAATLVLLTRHYPDRPAMFRWRERIYWQPSRKVPVSTWDCTHRASVQDAFELGRRDAEISGLT